MSTRLLRQLCTGAAAAPPRRTREMRAASDRALFVSYMDTATVRSRLVSVAQQVRAKLENDGMEPPPELNFPLGQRVRHGFWFMSFQREALALTATQTLQSQPFVAEIEHGRGERGAMSGTLQLDLGSRPTELRAMLNLDASEVREHEQWLRGAFGGHGEVEAIATPTLQCNWNPGYTFVTFAAPEHAEAALLALNGTPSCVAGCNIEADFAELKEAGEDFSFRERRGFVVEGKHGLPVDPAA